MLGNSSYSMARIFTRRFTWRWLMDVDRNGGDLRPPGGVRHKPRWAGLVLMSVYR